ncbi:MAG: hypothetical protein JSW64_06790 [Candidatus Zixiibacteriota bacterium]|nr:MAG: hypothetical protein JSW64_06790 [candidate division Zixibacteria bacterium]
MTNRYYVSGLLIGLLAICIVVIVSPQALSQATGPETYPDDLGLFKEQLKEPTYYPEHITKRPGHYTITDWSAVIDSIWGWGLTKTEKLAFFDDYWDTVDEDFACFPNLPGYTPGYWDSLRTLYRTEIVTGDSVYGVSRGRFAAIMNYLALGLNEQHSYVRDTLVNKHTSLDPGVPLFVTGGWGWNNHFGAGLTPLPDSSLLVYKAVNPHPVGLVPGDIVLGYDGIAWKDLYPQIMAAQLPFSEKYWRGSSESSYIHSLLMGAGANWHLFDTLDIVQYGTGDTLHFPTSLLDVQNPNLFCSEQLAVPGVPMPNVLGGELTSFGVISGTQIGYIYNLGWGSNDEQAFYNAIQTLMTDYQTTGLILDFRCNSGGLMHYGQKGFELLFNTTEPAYEWLVRCNPNDHLNLCSNQPPNDDTYFSYIYGAADSYYGKPIAVLVGPGTRSAGDFIALVMKYHPMTRFFGKSTTAAFSRSKYAFYTGERRGTYADAESYLHDNPGQYLTRSEFPVDEEVWLTQSDVAQGNDTVVDAAVTWINSQAGNQSDILCDVLSLDITLDPGEDTTQYLTITNNGSSHLFYSLTPLVDASPDMQTGEISVVKTSSQGKPTNEKSGNTPGTPLIQGQGGPDGYGYTWIDSDQPHGISPVWVDISTVGTAVILGNDAFDGPFGLGFDFQFYDSSYSEIYICSNGFVSFGGGHTESYNTPIPSGDSPDNIISPWWDDLDPPRGGDIYYYQDTTDSRFIVSYVDVEKNPFNSGYGDVTCQAILYSNGQIEFNYLDMEMRNFIYRHDYYTATIGIENIDGSDGLQVFYNAGYFFDNFSVRITTDWLAVTPASGYIAPGENVVAPVTVSARYLNYGIYTGNIYLDSNDPADSNIVIPVTMAVGAGCDYVVGDVNGSDSYNGLDITYGVAYFKGGNDPFCPFGSCPIPPCDAFFYCGDVNGSCNYNGLDITYGVAYFKGGSAPVPCGDCPPVE